MSEWQPIATAPKDGTFILAIMSGVHDELGVPYLPCIVQWRGLNCDDEIISKWCEADDTGENVFNVYCPTHWMPIPPPPVTDDDDDTTDPTDVWVDEGGEG